MSDKEESEEFATPEQLFAYERQILQIRQVVASVKTVLSINPAYLNVEGLIGELERILGE